MRGDGNGEARIPWVRLLGRILRPEPKGPFTGRDIERVLMAEGWVVVTGPPSNWITYRHPQDPTRRVAIDVEWSAVYEIDMTFQIVCQRTGISTRRLLDLLDG